MSTNTYVALKTTTVTGSSAASVTLDLTGITGYTDLFISCSVIPSSAASGYLVMQFNGDTTSTYSDTGMWGTGSSAFSGKNSTTYTYLNYDGSTMNSTAPVTCEINVMNYANTTAYKTVLSRIGNASGSVESQVHLWRATPQAITSILLKDVSKNLGVGSTFTVYGIANADVGAYATGGVITQDANYYYHAFGSSSTFTPTRNLTADILVVAGGGGGGNVNSGGGGAGGVLGFASQSLTSGTGYSCTVGAGGAGGAGGGSTLLNGTSGSNSQFASLTASVGGGYGSTETNGNGGSGGSGGGGGNLTSGGAGTSGQGYAGGNGWTASGNGWPGGGGGGAGGIGANAASGVAGNGGLGINSNANFTNLSTALTAMGLGINGYIAGGGGGGSRTGGSGGIGGTGGSGVGGNGANGSNGSNGVASTGSGGGGGGYDGTFYAGGKGGSGLIIVRYAR